MKIGYVGLGKMGLAMVGRMLEKGHEVVAFNRSPEPVAAAAKLGAIGASSYADLAAKLPKPRVIWIMVSHSAMDAVLDQLLPHLSAGDTIIDGGNSPYKDSMRRAAAIEAKGISFLDVGTSGGPAGARHGACLMIGGKRGDYEGFVKLWKDLSVPSGYGYMGLHGAGHFVKMVHNGIEYGMMQAMAEGFDILQGRASKSLPADQRFDLNVADIAEVWRRGSVVTSWLLDLTSAALARDDKLSSFSGVVEDSGEGRWTVEAAIEEAVPAEVLAASLFVRFRSRQDHTFAEKVLSAMRFGFGGHVEAPSKA